LPLALAQGGSIGVQVIVDMVRVAAEDRQAA